MPDPRMQILTVTFIIMLISSFYSETFLSGFGSLLELGDGGRKTRRGFF